MARVLSIIALLFTVAGAARAERQSLFPLEPARNAAVLSFGEAAAEVTSASASPSLFAGDSGRSFFAPLPARASAPRASVSGSTPVAQLLSLIAIAEAGSKGYDAVQYGARIRTPRPPTQMTLGEIYTWIEDTPGQPHAIGRYQFIPPTLRAVAARGDYGPETRFTPEVQDALAYFLLRDAGLSRFQSGALSRQDFMRNLARIWAGLPLPSGASYYEGYAGNSAAITWDTFEAGMARIFPAAG